MMYKSKPRSFIAYLIRLHDKCRELSYEETEDYAFKKIWKRAQDYDVDETRYYMGSTEYTYVDIMTPLTISILLQQPLFVLYLLKEGNANPNKRCFYHGQWLTPLELACRYSYFPDIAKYLVKNGATLVIDDGNKCKSYTETSRYTNNGAICQRTLYILLKYGLNISPKYKFDTRHTDNHKLALLWAMNFNTYFKYIPRAINSKIFRNVSYF